jgi:hypothetical protein
MPRRKQMTERERENFDQDIERMRRQSRGGDNQAARLIALKQRDAAIKAEKDWQTIESGEPATRQAGEVRMRQCPRCLEYLDPTEFRAGEVACYGCRKGKKQHALRWVY